MRQLLLILMVISGNVHGSRGNYLSRYPNADVQQENIRVNILDQNGMVTPARIRITGQDTVYYAPQGHVSSFVVGETKTGDAMLAANRRFAYTSGTLEIILPEGPCRFEVVKGYAYSLFDSTIVITPATRTITLRLNKWPGPVMKEWYAGDDHVHYIDPSEALLEMKAEDVNVCDILTSDCTTDQDNFYGAPDGHSDAYHIVYVNQEYREDQLGHLILLNLRKLVEPVRTMRKFQYPLNIQTCDEVHAQGGFVSWAHFAAWPGLEGPLAIVLKKVDAVELLSTIEPFSQPIFVSAVVPDVMMNSGLRLWYRLLNCGLKVPATAGTDKMSNRVTVGGNRVYAFIKGAFNYQSWISALKAGNSFVTNSPFLICSVDGKYPGALINMRAGKTIKIVAETWSQLPLDRLEIIVNGEVVAEKIIGEGEHHAKLVLEYKTHKSAWVAARAHQFNQDDSRNGVSFTQRRDFGAGSTLLNRYYGTLRPETVFAHTNPVYIEVNNKPIHSGVDAQYFIRYLQNAASWLKDMGKFPTEQAKQEVMAAYEKGIAAFARLAK